MDKAITMMKLVLEVETLPVILLVVDVHAPDDQEQDPRRSLRQDNLYQNQSVIDIDTMS